MASVQTSSYEGRYIKLTVVEESTSIPNNTSTLKWTVESIGGSSSYYTIYNASAVVNGTTVWDVGTVGWSTKKFPASKGSTSGTLTVGHKADGSADPVSFMLHGKVYSSGDEKKSGSLSLSTIPRYFTKTPTLTLKSKTETSITYTWTTSETCSALTWHGGGTMSGFTAGTTGTITITGLTAGTEYSHYGTFTRSDSGLTTDSAVSKNTTYSYPYINSTPNFKIGDELTIGIYNPLARTVKVYMLNPANTEEGGDSTTGTSIKGYNNSTWTNFWYAGIPNNTSGAYRVRLVCSELSRDTTVNGGTYQIIGTEVPTFTNFTYQDTNSSVTNIIGTNQVLVKGLSTPRVTISSANKMVANNSATAKSYVAILDTLNNSANYSTSDVNINLGTIANYGTKRLSVTAYDSRNKSTVVYKDITVVDYNKPVINASLKRLNDFENTTTLKVSGSFSKVTVGGTDKNTVTSLQYRYKESGGSFGAWTTLTTTINNGSYQCNDVILNLDNTKSFVFEITATDRLSSNTATGNVSVGQPIFFISTSTSKCYNNGVQIATLNDIPPVTPTADILKAVYPVGAIYISTVSTSPATLFGFGQWTQLKDRFLIGAGGSYAVNGTGGSASVNYTPAGTVGGHTLTTSEIPAHTHGRKTLTGQWRSKKARFPGSSERSGIITEWEANQSTYWSSGGGTDTNTVGWKIDASHEHDSVGGGGSHNHGFTGTQATINTMSPYLAVYMWKRTS